MTMALAHAQRIRWTIEQYERLHAIGMLPRDTRMELMDGEIVTMPPMQTPHGGAMTRGNTLLARLFGESHWIRVQCPLNVPEYWQPEPDFLLISMATWDPSSGHPTSADLVIEVSDTSLAYDRSEKASVYAMAGVPEYWIVNVVARCIEVRRQPRRDVEAPFGYSYGDAQMLSLQESVAPLFSPPTAVSVAAWF